ncbi:MAG: DUF5615 family PIN-like protein [Candidatus Nanohaloarchaea archaeon]
MDFLLDHHIDPAVAEGLKSRGQRAKTLWDEDLHENGDVDLVDYANERNMILVTNDDDFLTIIDSGRKHSGIVFITEQQMPVGEMIRGIISETRKWEKPDGSIAFV